MAQLKYKGTEGNYYVYDHPVAGEIKFRKDFIEENGDKPEVINNAVVEAYANKRIGAGDTPSTWEALSDTFTREFTSSARGAVEWLAGESQDKTKRTTSYEEDFMSEVYAKTNSGAYWTGLISGAVADPVTLPAIFLKALKAGKLAHTLQGAAAGGFGGFLQPDRTEWGTSTSSNVAWGVGIGAPLGLFVGTLLQRLAKKGIDIDPNSTSEELAEQLEKIADEGGESVQKIIFDESKEAAKTLADKSAAEIEQEFQQNLTVIQEDFRAANVADEQADIMSRLAERREVDGLRQQYEANLARIENDAAISQAEKDAIRKQYEENLSRIQGGDDKASSEFKARLRTNMEEAYTPEEIERRVRDSYLGELEEQIKGIQNIGLGTARENQAVVTDLRREIKNLNSMLSRAESGSKTKIPADDLRARLNKRVEDLADAEARRDGLKAREQAVADFVKIKKGETTPELIKRLQEAKYKPPVDDLPTPSQRVMSDLQRVTTQEVPAPTQQATSPEGMLVINRAMQGPQPDLAAQQQQILNRIQTRDQVPEFATPFKAGEQQPMNLQPTTVQAPVQSPVQSPLPQNPLAPPNTYIPTGRPQSLSSAGAAQDLPYSAVRQALNMNVNSKAARALPEARGVQASNLSDAKAVREAQIQQTQGEMGALDNIIQEGTEGGRVTDAIVDADTRATQRAVQSAIRDGEAINAADYLLQRFIETGGAVSMGEARLLEIAAEEARAMMEKSETKLLSLGRKNTAARVGEVQQMQLIAEEMEVYNRLREFVSVGQAAKGRASAMLRQYKKTNRLALDQIKRLREGKMVTQLFFGVDC